MYQGKRDDKVVTPASTLLLPLDNMKSLNANLFSSLGSDMLKGQESFLKAKSATKSFSTNLFQNNSLSDYSQPVTEGLYQAENLFSESLNYGLVRQHNLLSGSNQNVNASVEDAAARKLAENVFMQPYSSKEKDLLS
jgi:hypothetical protein